MKGDFWLVSTCYNEKMYSKNFMPSVGLIFGEGNGTPLEYFFGEGNGTPLQYSCLEKSHGWRRLVGCSPWDR